MHSPARSFRETIAADRALLGTFLVEFSGPAVAQVFSAAGFDFVMIDAEHGNFDPRQIESTIEACLATDLCPFVRTPHEGRELITRSLDAGAAGVVIPAIRDMDQVRRAVEATKYRPLGRRGVHLYRGHTRHQMVDPVEFTAQANRSTLNIIQIELAEAVEIVDQIAATDGVDGLYIGPGDLSVDLGVAGQWDAPILLDAIRKTVEACRTHGKIAGCHADDLAQAGTLVEMGVRMVGHFCDAALLWKGACAAAEQFRRLGPE